MSGRSGDPHQSPTERDNGPSRFINSIVSDTANTSTRIRFEPPASTTIPLKSILKNPLAPKKTTEPQVPSLQAQPEPKATPAATPPPSTSPAPPHKPSVSLLTTFPTTPTPVAPPSPRSASFDRPALPRTISLSHSYTTRAQEISPTATGFSPSSHEWTLISPAWRAATQPAPPQLLFPGVQEWETGTPASSGLEPISKVQIQPSRIRDSMFLS
ncbi:hypothetical protein MMC25_004389 [Agyrium rufum]|nr:hypothetical protein [Agyrium rufum]